MTITSPENALHWRNLADQLTEAQIAQLEEYEKKNPPIIVDLSVRGGFRSKTSEEMRESLLWKAREHVRDSMSDSLYAHVPPPAGAVSLWGHWEDWGDGVDQRQFNGTTRRIKLTGDEDAEVHICGTQYPDGHADRDEMRISNVNYDNPLTLAQARVFGQAVLDACDEAEQMTNCDPTVVNS